MKFLGYKRDRRRTSPGILSEFRQISQFYFPWNNFRWNKSWLSCLNSLNINETWRQSLSTINTITQKASRCIWKRYVLKALWRVKLILPFIQKFNFHVKTITLPKIENEKGGGGGGGGGGGNVYYITCFILHVWVILHIWVRMDQVKFV